MRLQELIECYITYRRALGNRFKTNANHLRAFGRAIGPRVTITGVRPEQVEAFLTGAGPITSNWHSKHNALLGFYRYALSRGYVSVSPLPAVVPRRPPPLAPYIYTHDELRRLLSVTDATGAQSWLEPVTLRTIVLLLYGAGLRVHEAIALDRADVELSPSLLTVRQTKFYKTRLVPFGPALGRVLTAYAAQPAAPPYL